MKSNLIGRRVDIIDHESIYYREWGIVIYYDGDVYHIAIANGRDSVAIFSRDQFRVRRIKK